MMVGALSLVAMLLWALPGQTAETLKIGYIGNFSWIIAGDAFYAAKLAVDEINKVGGIQGRQVDVVKATNPGKTFIPVNKLRKGQ